jgi:hypothetical protein
MTDHGPATPSIVDVLTGRGRHEPQVRITPGQRVYYNYRIDKPSFDAEIANIGVPPSPRDFRSRRQRDEDA